MKGTLHQHFVFLEERIQSLRDQTTGRSLSHEEIERLNEEIQIAELALDHFRAALELERKIS